MNEQTPASTIIRKRMRRIAGQLTEDASLRDNLIDAQAQRTLDWGLALVEETAVKTANLPDDDALPLLEERVTAVRATLHLVSRLMGEPPTSDRIEEQLTRLLKNIAGLKGQTTGYSHLRRAEQFQRAHANQDPIAAFDALYELLEGNFAAEQAPPEPTTIAESTPPPIATPEAIPPQSVAPEATTPSATLPEMASPKTDEPIVNDDFSFDSLYSPHEDY